MSDGPVTTGERLKMFSAALEEKYGNEGRVPRDLFAESVTGSRISVLFFGGLGPESRSGDDLIWFVSP
jgi:hypothetical protein